jgi:Protein of unknown function (DUF1579)
MKIFVLTTTIFAAALIAVPLFAQKPSPANSPAGASRPPIVATSPVAAPSGSPSEAEMMKQMMDLRKLNENHKLLADLAGDWTYIVKFWMSPDPNAEPQQSNGAAVIKPIMDGRYFITNVSGKMKMPGPDGKMKEMDFKGMGIDGYDNVKQKFVSTWIDNMGTGIEFSDGIYNPATKTFTYDSEVEPMPGVKTKVREVLKIADKDHHTLEWYENRDGKEVKTMEINYTRAKTTSPSPAENVKRSTPKSKHRNRKHDD